MDVHLDTLSTKLYQVNIRVDQIVWWQVVIGGFVSETSPPPTPEASEAEDEDNDHNATASEEDDDGDANSFGIDEMSTWHSYPLSLMTKRGSSFGY